MTSGVSPGYVSRSSQPWDMLSVARLTVQQAKFCELFLSNGGDASAAYREAYRTKPGDKTIGQRAWKLKRSKTVATKLAEVQAVSLRAVDRAVEQYSITAERVAQELALLAFTRMPQLADVKTEAGQDGKQHQRVIVRDFAAVDQDALAAISEVKRTAGGEVSIKLYDKRAALMDIARLKGWVADKPVDNRQLVVFKVER